MSDHLHVVVRMLPEGTASWTAVDVARRWLSLYPRRYAAYGSAILPSDEAIALQAQYAGWVEARRKRLADLGWFMKGLKEPIARRANREDACTGAFWEERYASVPLLDQAALVACMAYVDLNPVRAAVTDRPERTRHTAVRQRIPARQRHRAAQRILARSPRAAPRLLARAGITEPPRHAEDGLWLAPLARCQADEALTNRQLTAEEYLTLVDQTGRLLRADKRRGIPAELTAILARLDLQLDDWLATMCGWRQMGGSALGAAAARAAEATRRGLRWVQNRCALFARRTGAAA